MQPSGALGKHLQAENSLFGNSGLDDGHGQPLMPQFAELSGLKGGGQFGLPALSQEPGLSQ